MESKGKPKKSLLNLILPLCILGALLAAVLISVGIVKHEARTNQLLAEENAALRTEAEEAKAALLAEQNGDNDTSFDYLAIGNSITQHPVIDDLWWGEWGMAASDADHDYYHLVCKGIEEKYPDASEQVLNFRIWEEPPYNRDDMLKYLKGYVTEDLDYITIMLGDNYDREEDEADEAYRLRAEADYGDLIRQLKEMAPKAKIVLIGCFWDNVILDSAIMHACEKASCPFISLFEIQDDEYREGNWETVEGSDDTDHLVLGTGAAEHPNDKGMAYIAEKVLDQLP